MRVFIGYDPIEDEAYQVAKNSMAYYAGSLQAEPLDEEKLRAHGLYSRPVDKRGQPYDVISNAPCSTEFATSRFLVPILCQTGWALFTDCDVVFFGDVRKLQDLPKDKAVYVVKHKHKGHGTKMGGLAQTKYSRKNWSSVMLFNCDHPANRRLSLRDVNERPGRDLHQFYWLADDEIGELHGGWNWLVDEQPQPKHLEIAHFTLGGPWLPNWEGGGHDDLWNRQRDTFLLR